MAKYLIPASQTRSGRKDWEWKEVFLGNLAVVPNVGRACRVAGVSRQTAYQARKQHPDFAAEWDAALENGIDMVEEAMLARAMDLDSKTGVTAGIFMLKVHRYERRSHDQAADKEDTTRQDEQVDVIWADD